MMKIKAFIFARGGSKGVPQKNLQQIGGISLVGRAVKQALVSSYIDEVIISTDAPEIAKEAQSHGATCNYLRPSYLSSDTANEWDAWRHAVNEEQENNSEFDLFVSIPPTAPLRESSDIDRAISDYLEYKPDMLISGSKTDHNPYFNMVKMKPDQSVELACKGEGIHRRQDAPAVYNIATVCYVTSPAYVLEHEGLWKGITRLTEVDPINATDIDSPLDLEYARFLHQKRKKLKK